jgi:hypothetical protein
VFRPSYPPWSEHRNNMWFDTSTLPRYVQIPKRSSFPGQSTIANARALWRYLQLSEVSQSVSQPASHSVSVVVQSYCSLFLITFCNFLNRISEIMDHTMNIKADVQAGLVNQRIVNRRLFMEPIKADYWGITIHSYTFGHTRSGPLSLWLHRK